MKKIGKNMLTIYTNVIYATIPLTKLKFAKKEIVRSEYSYTTL